MHPHTRKAVHRIQRSHLTRASGSAADCGAYAWMRMCRERSRQGRRGVGAFTPSGRASVAARASAVCDLISTIPVRGWVRVVRCRDHVIIPPGQSPWRCHPHPRPEWSSYVPFRVGTPAVAAAVTSSPSSQAECGSKSTTSSDKTSSAKSSVPNPPSDTPSTTRPVPTGIAAVVSPPRVEVRSGEVGSRSAPSGATAVTSPRSLPAMIGSKSSS